VVASYISDYTAIYSSGCYGTASGGLVKCIVTNKYTPPPGSTTFLNVITTVDNTKGGTKRPSDFTISVSGNRPSPESFSGSSSGTSVTLKAGSYQVSEDSIPDYSTSYSSACSGTASGGLIKCTISNQYHTKPAPSPPSNTTISSSSYSIYSIPSTFVKVETFSTNYTIAGKTSFLNASQVLTLCLL
jgi:Prealbumin-like fold domain